MRIMLHSLGSHHLWGTFISAGETPLDVYLSLMLLLFSRSSYTLVEEICIILALTQIESSGCHFSPYFVLKVKECLIN